MQIYDKFYFEKYSFDTTTLTARLEYSFDHKEYFVENIFFPMDEIFLPRENINSDIIDNILFHLHIALGISYYKFYPTCDLVVLSWKLNETQIKFWEKFYLQWLGEFFYTNWLDPREFVNFVNNSDIIRRKIDFLTSEKYLVPVWWWKDSIVSIELLKEKNKKIGLVTFAVNDNILYENTAHIAGLDRLFIKREMSENIKNMIDQGQYNGHVPITWMIAFVLELAAYLYDYRYIVLSNEFSANFENTNWKWLSINHQYSKSLEFEQDFDNYVKNYISNEVVYFSFLSSFYELKIAEIFSKKASKYFTSFSSCNTNFKIFKKEKDIQNIQEKKYWCNVCPKCAFVYAILRPFLTDEEVLSIFWKDLYDDSNLENLFRELAGISGIKPLECVWTNEEVILAMKMYYYKISKIKKLPFMIEVFRSEIYNKFSPSDWENLESKIMWYNTDNLIPEELK